MTYNSVKHNTTSEREDALMKRHVNTAGICCFRVLQGDGGSVNLFGIRGGAKGGGGGGNMTSHQI